MLATDQIPVSTRWPWWKQMVARTWNQKGGYIDAHRGALGRAIAVAVMATESAGAATSSLGEPVIRVENHKLWSNKEALTVDWGQKNPETYAKYFRKDEAPYGHLVNFDGSEDESAWQPFHGSQTQEWRVFDLAARLAGREVAARCISIGAGQVMGFNAQKLGYRTAEEMLDDMTSSVQANVGGVFAFIEANEKAKKALAAKDYEGFAAEYNGEKCKVSYGGYTAANVAYFEALEAEFLSGDKDKEQQA